MEPGFPGSDVSGFSRRLLNRAGPRLLLTLLLAYYLRDMPANMFAVASSSAVRAPARASASKPSRGAKLASAVRDDAKAVVATSAIVAPAAFPASALAVDKDAIESFVSTVESDKDVVLSLFSKVADAASAAKEALAPVADQLAPVAREVTKEGAVVAREVTTKAAPVVKSIEAEAGKDVDVAIEAARGAVKSTGIDTAPIESASKSVAGVAKSVASAVEPALVGALDSVNEYITHLPSAVTTGASTFAALAVVTSPLWWDAFVRSARGYAGDVHGCAGVRRRRLRPRVHRRSPLGQGAGARRAQSSRRARAAGAARDGR